MAEGLQPGEEYLAGVLDMGALGKHNVAFFKNKQKTDDNQPDYKSSHGALWIRKKGDKGPTVEEEIVP